jgi:hypothetical protein
VNSNLVAPLAGSGQYAPVSAESIGSATAGLPLDAGGSARLENFLALATRRFRTLSTGFTGSAAWA